MISSLIKDQEASGGSSLIDSSNILWHFYREIGWCIVRNLNGRKVGEMRKKKFPGKYTIQAQTCSARVYTLARPVTLIFITIMEDWNWNFFFSWHWGPTSTSSGLQFGQTNWWKRQLLCCKNTDGRVEKHCKLVLLLNSYAMCKWITKKLNVITWVIHFFHVRRLKGS